MSKTKRFLSLLVTMCTILSLFVAPAHATDQDIDGNNGGGGVGGGSGEGTFASSQQGYRMYIIDNEGKIKQNNSIGNIFPRSNKLLEKLHSAKNRFF